LAGARRRLAAAGCDTPRLDAELLLAAVLGADRAALLMECNAGLAPGPAARFEALIARRADREPVAYILGRRGFRHLEIEVDPRVLVPRPETELLVEAALALPPGARVLDVGTGSGAVALALKHERPDLVVTGSDVSAEALAVAQANARRLELEVDFRLGDLLEGAGERIDAVVANLPYVPERELGALAPEIVRHEPALALAAGPAGLELIRRLLVQASAIPWIALEVGAGQADRVGGLMDRAGFSRRRVLRDLAGIERVVVGRRG
jgi:release factor glutamine methyltransferase